jgi:hypothetical protein
MGKRIPLWVRVSCNSHAGGVGALNHAKWFKDHLSEHAPLANLSVLLDSSWFINFKGDIQREFHTAVSSEPEEEESLFDIISQQDSCDFLHMEAPCCISASCMLSRREFYPSNVPVFAIVSLYDVFLLGANLRGLVTLATEEVYTSISNPLCNQGFC